jgi:tRNA (guanosine-2'-O-)-methyltransferase
MEKLNLIKFLSELVTDDRLNNFNRVLDKRTRYLSVVLEDIYQSQNASAVLRTCDCFGVQDIHIIENKYKYNVNPDVALGSAQWLNLKTYKSKDNNTLSTIKTLKKQNYRIVATTPHTNDCKLEDIDLTRGKIALFFGSELPGLSNVVMENADEFVKIPMVGFTESFNISVSAALCLYSITTRLRNSDVKWQLTADERDDILLDWLKTSIKDSENIVKLYHQRTNQV